MRYNRLGQTGLFVSELCLGTMTFGQSKGRYAAASGVDQEAVNAILRRAIDAGINFIDTADVYAGGQAEEIVGRSLKTLGIARKDVVIATKFEHATGPGPNDGGGSRAHIVDAVQASCRRLGVDHIDLYQMHGWDPATPIEETLQALDDLVRKGLVRYVGSIMSRRLPLRPQISECNRMLSAFSQISLVAIIAASFAVMMLGWLWFAVLFARPYALVLGRIHDPKAKMAPLYIVGPSLCMVVTAVALAVLMKATGVSSFSEAVGLGALVGVGLLASTAMNMAINPNIPRPIAYGAMSASYFLLASVMISAILYLVS